MEQEGIKMIIDWQKVSGLLPVIVQESGTNEILMFAYMNEDALNLSLQTGYAHYFSRTKNRLWKKGEESGNTQIINEIYLDCDNDTLLIKITQNGGAACHTGAKSCFFRKIEPTNLRAKTQPKISTNTTRKESHYNIIDELYHSILDRKLNADPAKSYVASLFKKGENAILKKVGEEATEFIMACKDETANALFTKNLSLNSDKIAIASEILGYGINIVDSQNLSKVATDVKNINKGTKIGLDKGFKSTEKATQNLNQNNANNSDTIDVLYTTNNLQNQDRIFSNNKVLSQRITDLQANNEITKTHRSDIVYEAADLCFHTLVALAEHNIHPDQIKHELASRFGISGIEEKNSRDK